MNEQIQPERLRQHEDEINAALVARLPGQLQMRSAQAAIDEPFYGKSPELAAYTCRSKAKAGTTRFFRIISLYVIYRQMRLTLAVAFVLPTDNLVAIMDRLLQRIQPLQIRLDVPI